MAHLVRRFDSWGEFVDYAENAKTDLDYDSRHSRFENSSKTAFTRTRSFADAIKLALDGWPEGVENAKKMASPIVDRISNLIERQDVVYDVEGAGIDVSRFVDGEPECWQRFEAKIVENPGTRIIHLVFNIFTSCGVEADVMVAKGAAIASLVQLLEFGGHRVQVTLYSSCRGRMDPNLLYEACVPVKLPDQDLDFGRLVFALAHPSTLRRLFFSVEECEPATIRGKFPVPNSGGGGYGIPTEATEQGDLYIGRSFYGEPQWTNQESVERWIIDQLKAQGITLREEKEAM